MKSTLQLFGLCICLWLLNATSLSAQLLVDLCPSIPAGTLTQEEVIDIPIIADQFEDVIAFQFSINYNPDELEFQEIVNAPDALDFNEANPGNISIIWSDIENPIAIASFDTLLVLRMLVTGNNVESPDVLISGAPTDVVVETTTLSRVVTLCGEVYNPDLPNNIVDFCSPIIDGPFAADEVVANPIQVTGFTSIKDFSILVEYSAEFYEFIDVVFENGLPGEGNGQLVGPGLINITFSIPDFAPGVTLIDGSTPFSINLRMVDDQEFVSLDVSPEQAVVTYFNETSAIASACGFISEESGITDFCPVPLTGPFTTGQLVDINIAVTDFAGLSYVAIPLTFDSTLLRFNEVVNFATSNNGSSSVSWETTNAGTLKVYWLDFADTGAPLPDGTNFLTIQMEVLQDTTAVTYQIAPAAGPFFGTASSTDFTATIPISACGEIYLGQNLVNLRASVYRDATNDCSGEPVGDKLSGWTVQLTDNVSQINASATTNANGDAYIFLPPGDYTINWTPPNGSLAWLGCVNQDLEITNPGSLQTLTATANAVQDCSDTYVYVSSFNLRPCFSNNRFFLDYGNWGSTTAEDAYIDVVLDPSFILLSATLPFTDLGDNVVRFELGDIAPNASGRFSITGIIDCDLPVGSAVCTAATIYPNKECETPPADFLGGEMTVKTFCEGDNVRFRVRNNGNGPTGPVNFTVIEDVVIYMESTLDLEAGGFEDITLPAEGTTYRLTIDRPFAAPYLSHPLGIAEGCGTLPGGGISLGFVNSFSLLDDDPFLDRYCQETTAAFDPNDKQAIPRGVDTENFIYPNGTLDYKIRFQNTGTDTAFTVVIKDTLDLAVLDINALRYGPSSHPYYANIVNDSVLTFTFENILLVDSTTNEAESHGYVHFTIAQQPDLANMTRIENSAAIYFDFNEPIITNISGQTVMDKFLATKVFTYPGLAEPLSVYPSPAHEYLQIGRTEWPGNLSFTVYDVYGRQVLSKDLQQSDQRINVGSLPAGHYAYRITQANQLLQTGLIQKH